MDAAPAAHTQKSLTYLDSRPVTERDRACAEAWRRGGYAAERAEQERWIKAAKRKTKEDINRLLQKRNDRGHEPQFKLVSVSHCPQCLEGSASSPHPSHPVRMWTIMVPYRDKIVQLVNGLLPLAVPSPSLVSLSFRWACWMWGWSAVKCE